MVQERLGHKKITTTLDIYAHVLPDQDQETADTPRLSAAWHKIALGAYWSQSMTNRGTLYDTET